MAANGQFMKVLGQAETTVSINGLSIPYTFLIVKNLQYQAIIGLNFLSDTKATIDLENKVISFAINLLLQV